MFPILVIIGAIVFITILYYVIRAAVLSAILEARYEHEPDSKARQAHAKKLVEEFVVENEMYFTETLKRVIKRAITEAKNEETSE